jgi:hypothetical protein
METALEHVQSDKKEQQREYKRKWKKEHPEKVREERKRYRQKHPIINDPSYQKKWREQHPDYSSKWKKEHPDYDKEWKRKHPHYSAEWKQKHPNYFSARSHKDYPKKEKIQKVRREPNKERLAEYRKKWKQEHPEKVKQYRQKSAVYDAQFRKKWRETHPDYLKNWKGVNAEKFKEYGAKWRKAHPLPPKRVRMYTFIHDHPELFPLALTCELCEETQDLMHHHPDYDYPEIYVTCCKVCHVWIHKKRNWD